MSPRRLAVDSPVIAVIIAVALLTSARSTTEQRSDRPAPVAPTTSIASPPDTPGDLAEPRVDVRLGAAVDAERLRSEPDYQDAVASHFTSVTPENAMKWTTLRPDPNRWDGSAARFGDI